MFTQRIILGLVAIFSLFDVECSATNRQTVDLMIKGGFVLTMDKERSYYQNGAVAIRNKVIVDIGEEEALCQRFEAKQVINASGKLIMPGLINLHAHMPMTLLRGIEDDLPLMDWLQKAIWPAERRNINPEFIRCGMELACWEMLQNGVTTAVDAYFLEEERAIAAKKAGIRLICGVGILDTSLIANQRADDLLGSAEKFIKKWKGDELIVPAVAPHSIYLCSSASLIKSKQLADEYRIPMLIHVAETSSEEEMSRVKYSMTPTQYLNHIGALGSNVIISHAVFIPDGDIGILKEKDVRIAHCPQSNMKLACGVAPVPKFLKSGVLVGLGTDGAASNNNLDIFSEMKAACLLHKIATQDPTAISAEQAVAMATIDAAQALNMGHLIGSLEKGKLADLIILDLNQPNLLPLYNVYSLLAYSATGANVETTIVNGKIVMSNRQMQTLDIPLLMKRIARQRQQVIDSIKEENNSRKSKFSSKEGS